MRPSPKAVFLSLAAVLPLVLTGCTLSSTAPLSPETGAAISGRVHGGESPIVGAQVYLLAANTIGYGSSSLSLLTSGDGPDAGLEWRADQRVLLRDHRQQRRLQHYG